ncbi:thiol reductant ABC exporter subunit CydC [Gleimia hominis]|uniref:Thiol reductant ABC exporter subunit CydC n=1 Tax=Gleimia hominis TaxID=595468 RepID=A0ABU3ICN0_9ACTO|nr:thiol reductant ABC exporter subunit CydC [Gleimia hominis]MDT3768130.1 thiol reductant ABC exporter subunit CydC [Gleimia hominis]
MNLFLSKTERRAIRRILRLLEISKPKFALAVLLGALGIGAAIGLGATSAWLIARASQQPPVMYLMVATVGVRFFGVSKAVLRYAQRLASHAVAMDGIAALRDNVYAILARSQADKVVSLRRGDLLARTGTDVDAVGDLLVKSVLPAAVALVCSAGTVVGIAFLSVGSALVLLLGLALSGVAGPLLTVVATRRSQEATDLARTELAANAVTLVDHASELAVEGRLPAVHNSIAETETRLRKAKNDAAFVAGLAAFVDLVGVAVAVSGAMWIGIPSTLGGTLAAVALAVVVLTPLSAFEATSDLGPAAVQLVKSARAAVRLDDLLSAAPQGQAHLEPGLTPVLEAKDLAVGWPGGPVVASGINLTLRPGSHTGIVGPSGIGKTTLLYTLAGLLEPKSGSVTLCGRDIHTLARADVGKYVSLTAEDAHVFATTVLENLRVATPTITAEDAHELLRRAGLGQWAAELTDGVGTLLGSEGSTISGGERRRLLLARALASPAPLMLIDEPGEHVDTQTADGLIRDLLESDQNRGALVVTHRLTPLEAADEVLVLDPTANPDGTRSATVSARGSHNDLKRTNEQYQWALSQEGDTDDLA